MKLAVGLFYRLRNRALVKITGTFDVHWLDRATLVRRTATLFQGQHVGHEGEKISWWADGSYSPVQKHPLDVVARLKERPDV